jgi:RpiB/LacA/LacB family sugar-phosphate isomerase
MNVVVACDHTSLLLKDVVINTLEGAGHTVIDVGTFSNDTVDFPDMAEKGGRVIQEGKAERGVFICGSGVGVSITANKMKGIYAGLCHDTYSAHQGVEHDNMNVLCLGGRIIGPEVCRELVLSFINARYIDSEPRFAMRVNKIKNIEKLG